MVVFWLIAGGDRELLILMVLGAIFMQCILIMDKLYQAIDILKRNDFEKLSRSQFWKKL
jgi:hypothetical protein